MEDKGNADRVGKDKVYATELLVSSTLALDEMTSRMIVEIEPDLVVSDAVAKRVEELGAGVRLKSISEEDVLQALRQIIYEPESK